MKAESQELAIQRKSNAFSTTKLHLWKTTVFTQWTDIDKVWFFQYNKKMTGFILKSRDLDLSEVLKGLPLILLLK